MKWLYQLLDMAIGQPVTAETDAVDVEKYDKNLRL
jgi:hypothetical protein